MSTEGDDEVRSVIGAMGAMLYKFVRETHRVIKTFSAALVKKSIAALLSVDIPWAAWLF